MTQSMINVVWVAFALVAELGPEMICILQIIGA